MLGTILAIIIPVGYLFFGAGTGGYVYEWGDLDEFDRPILAILTGIFWPVALPFYLSIQGAKKRRKARIERDLQARAAGRGEERPRGRPFSRRGNDTGDD